MNIASYIDHTILKQTTGKNDVATVCQEAKDYGFAAVCIPPVFVKQAAESLKDSDIKVATVIGFPFGYTFTSIKEQEALNAIKAGAQELDMVINVGALKEGNETYVEKEVASLAKLSRQHSIALKVIVESGILTEKELLTCCRLLGAHEISFMKTSTGYAEQGATVEAVQVMRHHLPSHIQIKASGGIRTYDFAKQLVDAGATRLGCSASVAITKGENSASSNY